MNDKEVEKARIIIITEIVDYIPDSVVIKTILTKITGSVKAVSFDTGESFAKKTSPFDTLIQVIEGNAEIIIDSNPLILTAGESVVIPAHTMNAIKASKRLKIISTVIKSGYEEFA